MRIDSFSDFVDLTGSPLLRDLSNDEISKLTGLESRRITRSTGVSKRRIIADGVKMEDIAIAAAETLFDQGFANRKDIGVIAVSHTHFNNESAGIIQHALAKYVGLTRDKVHLISFGCAGFPHALHTATTLLSSIGPTKEVLVTTVEMPSQMMDARDSKAAPIFADQMTATTLRQSPDGHQLLFAHTNEITIPDNRKDGWGFFSIQERDIINFQGQNQRKTTFQMNGDLVFEHGRNITVDAMRESLRFSLLQCTDYSGRVIVVPHQPNGRMLKQIADYECSACKEQFPQVTSIDLVNGIDGMGNVISSTIPSVLARIQNVLINPPQKGDLVLMPAAGICMEDPENKMSAGYSAMIW